MTLLRIVDSGKNGLNLVEQLFDLRPTQVEGRVAYIRAGEVQVGRVLRLLVNQSPAKECLQLKTTAVRRGDRSGMVSGDPYSSIIIIPHSSRSLERVVSWDFRILKERHRRGLHRRLPDLERKEMML